MSIREKTRNPKILHEYCKHIFGIQILLEDLRQTVFVISERINDFIDIEQSLKYLRMFSKNSNIILCPASQGAVIKNEAGYIILKILSPVPPVSKLGSDL